MIEKNYSQWKAMLAITRAGLRGMLRNPSTVFFSLAFPMIFILVFGFIGNGNNAPTYKIVVDKNSDTTNAFFDSVKSSKRIRILRLTDAEVETYKQKGRLAGILLIRKTNDSIPAYTYTVRTTSASDDQWPQLLPILESINTQISNKKFSNRPTYALDAFDPAVDRTETREYKTIDFILPGQLGFSLLSASIFGVAFLFFSLRETVVLKRFFATPIQRTFIVLGESLARVIFQMITAIVIVVMGRFLFGFTLVHGLLTFLEMMVLCFLSILVFMGFGFIVSNIAKNSTSIPLLGNIITLPQFLLAGTFFSIENFPSWLQPICRILPLTHFNDAMRKIAFEGAHLTDCLPQIGVILLWGVAAYAVAIKVFKWE